MKVEKLLAVLITVAMTLGAMCFPAFAQVEGSWSEFAAQSYATPIDEEAKTVTIASAQELALFALQMNEESDENYAGYTVILTADIDLGDHEWVPIGTKDKPFAGSFNGQGHVISNLTINKPTQSYVGLFGRSKGSDAEIKNFTIENASVTGYLNVGSVIGEMNIGKALQDITVRGDVFITGMSYVGGITGGQFGYASLINCDVLAEAGSYVYADSVENGIDYRTYVGGITGQRAEGNYEIKDCDAKIDVTGTVCNIGGVSGNQHYGNKFINCTYEGTLTLEDTQEGTTPAQVLMGAIAGSVLANEKHSTLMNNCTFNGRGVINGTDVTEELQPAEWYSDDNKESTGVLLTADINGEEKSLTNCVAMIGEQGYTTLADAIADAESGDIVVLLRDVEITETYTITNTNPMTIDFGGHYIDVTKIDADTESICVAQGANVTFTGEGGINAYKNCLTNNGGIITLNGGTYSTTMIGRGSGLYNEAGTLNINNGVVVDAYKFALYNETEGICNLNGGTLVSHAHNGLKPEDPSLAGYAYTVVNAGTMNVYDGAVIKGIQGALSASGKGVTNVYGGTVFTHEDEENTTGRSYYACYAANNADLTIFGGTFTSAKRAAVYVGNEDVGLDGAKVNIKGGTFQSNGDVAAAIQTDITGDLSITGGNFSSDVSAYVPSGYYQTENTDGTYTIQEAAAKVIDTVKTTGVEVTLNDLEKNSAVDLGEDATYKVVVSTPSEADVAAVNAAIEADGNVDSEKAIFDISVKKTTSAGTTEDVSDEIKNQKVTLTLGAALQEDTVSVYHVNDEKAEKIEEIVVSGNTVAFVAPSFSTYAITYQTAAVAEDNITGEVGVVFTPVAEGSNQYYINLKALDEDKIIHRFMSADLVFKNNGISYDIEPAANMSASIVNVSDNSSEYHFEMNGTVASSATGSSITIGTITFRGYGMLDFSIDTAYVSEHAINIVNTAKVADNIVDSYTVAGQTLVVNDGFTQDQLAEGESGTITGEIKPVTKNLTIQIAFPNEVKNNEMAYQNMKVEISGGDLSNTKEIVLGSDNADVSFDDEAKTYTITIEDELLQNVKYTVAVSGEGYRTVRYTVNMTADKTLNFWNNAKDSETVIETGNDASKRRVTFLAGDIVQDNTINIYDLSAVVSYFGTDNLVEKHAEYARYDLNRDGKIDSKDVAMVLVSWNE